MRKLKMRKITKIRRSVKAISPVISVLLMIAIAVAASLVAYAWVSGYMDFTTTKVGKSIQIQSVATNAVYVQNIGDSDVEIADLYVDGTLESWYSISVETVSTQTVGQGETATILLNSPLPRTGNQATIKIVTSDGISAEYKETFSSISSSSSQTQYLVTVTPTANGGIAPPSGYVAEGSTPSYTITPSTNYHIASITANGVSVTVTNPAGQTYTFPAVSGSCTLTATFTEIAATTYTITASAGAGGSISPSGSVTVTEGADQGFTITADNDYHIVDVVVDSVSQGAISTYNFPNVVANHAIEATFEADAVTYTITASAGAGGSISPSGSVTVTEGADQGFTITADNDYHIVDVVVDSVSQGAISTYNFPNVVANHAIEATFAEDAPVPVALFDDDFESSSLGSEYVDSRLVVISTTESNSPTRSVRLQGTGYGTGDDDGYLILQISTTGYSDIELSYWRMFEKDTTDILHIEWRVGTSGSWTNLESIEDEAAWAQQTWDLSGAGNESALQIRFRLERCESTDYAYIDDIVIMGTAI